MTPEERISKIILWVMKQNKDDNIYLKKPSPERIEVVEKGLERINIRVSDIENLRFEKYDRYEKILCSIEKYLEIPWYKRIFIKFRGFK